VIRWSSLRRRSKRPGATIAGVSAQPQPAGDADLATVGALLAEPARAKVLLALADGRSLPASMLASEAGVAASTASHHLARLAEAGFVLAVTRGRHRYFTLAGPQVAELLEAVARVAPPRPVTSLREGTRAHALRYARRCYDHLAGRLGVAVADALVERGVIVANGGAGFTVTGTGAGALAALGIAASPGDVARCCLDWTEQRPHVAGALGRDLMDRVLELGWVACDARTRALRLTDAGRSGLPARLGVLLP
jgi:DNA-binding transcriptional ArsR family regulator